MSEIYEICISCGSAKEDKGGPSFSGGSHPGPACKLCGGPTTYGPSEKIKEIVERNRARG